MSDSDKHASHLQVVDIVMGQLQQEGFEVGPFSRKQNEMIHVTAPKESWVKVHGDRQQHVDYLCTPLPGDAPDRSFVVFVDFADEPSCLYDVLTADEYGKVYHAGTAPGSKGGWVYRSEIAFGRDAWDKLR